MAQLARAVLRGGGCCGALAKNLTLYNNLRKEIDEGYKMAGTAAAGKEQTRSGGAAPAHSDERARCGEGQTQCGGAHRGPRSDAGSTQMRARYGKKNSGKHTHTQLHKAEKRCSSEQGGQAPAYHTRSVI